MYVSGLLLMSLVVGGISPRQLFVRCGNGLLVFSVGRGDANFSSICHSCLLGGISLFAFCFLTGSWLS